MLSSVLAVMLVDRHYYTDRSHGLQHFLFFVSYTQYLHSYVPVFHPLYEGRTLYRCTTIYIVGVHNNCKVLICAAPAGAGNVAGKGVRSILDVMGIRDSTTKVFGRQNSYSIVLAALKAFENYESAQMVALKRGKRLMDVNKVMRDHNTTND